MGRRLRLELATAHGTWSQQCFLGQHCLLLQGSASPLIWGWATVPPGLSHHGLCCLPPKDRVPVPVLGYPMVQDMTQTPGTFPSQILTTKDSDHMDTGADPAPGPPPAALLSRMHGALLSFKVGSVSQWACGVVWREATLPALSVGGGGAALHLGHH